MKKLFVPVLLAMTTSVHAAVTCTNENTSVSETTPGAEFSDNDDGTVTQTRMGLVWMRCSLGQSWDGSATTYAWQASLQAAQDINSGASDADGDGTVGFAGQSDWRLPNRNELESIVEERCWNPSINAAEFPNTPSGWFWSSSPNAYGSDFAWGVGSDTGDVSATLKVYTGAVRLVRAGP